MFTLTERTRGTRLKIERAEKHIRDLDTAISDFLGTHFYSLGTKPKPNIGHVAYYVTRVDPLPDDIPLMLGDAIHNLRSALDHLFWQLVEANGGTTGSQTAFPITKTVQQYNAAFGKQEITTMRRPELVEVLRQIQPYRTTDDTLWRIHQLDIVDKHKLIIPVATALDRWGLKEPDIWLGDLSGAFHIELGEELLNVPADTYEKSHDNIKFGTDVTFRDSEIAGGKSVLETLNEMADFIRAIVGNLERFLIEDGLLG